MEQFSPLQHSEQFVIRTYEIDHRRLATVPALVRLMHEAAMQNVLRLGLSVWDLEPHRLTWVLMRKELRIERLPRLGEPVTIVTYPAGFERFFTYRDYRVFDGDGRPLANSSSTWLLMDTRRRRLTRIPPFILELAPDMPAPGRHLPRPADQLPAFGEAVLSRSHRIGFFDLDFNDHLNNTFYLTWMLEALPDDVLQNLRLRGFDIHYHAEAYWKEELRAESHPLDDRSFLHRLVRPADGKELAVARSEWEV